MSVALALAGWSVVAFWRNDGKADLELHCPGWPACPWRRTTYGDPDAEAPLLELVLAALEHNREGHAGHEGGQAAGSAAGAQGAAAGPLEVAGQGGVREVVVDPADRGVLGQAG